RPFRRLHEVERAYEAGDIALHTLIEFRGLDENGDRVVDVPTTAGRLFFNQALPESFEFMNARVDKKVMGDIANRLANHEDKNVVATSLDAIKNLCFRYASQSGITISIDDVKTPPEKAEIMAAHETQAQKVEDQFRRGIITDGERRQKEVEIWTDAT